MKRHISERGSALVIATVVTVIVAGLSASYITYSLFQSKFTYRDLVRENAFYLAEAGIANSMGRMNMYNDMTQGDVAGTIKSGIYTVTALTYPGAIAIPDADYEERVRIVSIGQYGLIEDLTADGPTTDDRWTATRRIEVITKRLPDVPLTGLAAVTIRSGITAGGNMTVDGRDHSQDGTTVVDFGVFAIVTSGTIEMTSAAADTGGNGIAPVKGKGAKGPANGPGETMPISDPGSQLWGGDMSGPEPDEPGYVFDPSDPTPADDDGDGFTDEESFDGVDNDGDGLIDEDVAAVVPAAGSGAEVGDPIIGQPNFPHDPVTGIGSPDVLMGLPIGTLKASAQAAGTYFNTSAEIDAYIAANGGTADCLAGKIVYVEPGGVLNADGFYEWNPATFNQAGAAPVMEPPMILVVHRDDGLAAVKNMHIKASGLFYSDGGGHINATSEWVGAAVVGAQGTNAALNGGGEVKYSTEALANLPSAVPLVELPVLSWKELSPKME